MMSTAAAGAKLVVAFGVAESPEGDGLHAYPAGAYFCMHKSRQNALGAVPQDPLAAKLRLDTLSRCLRRILFWTQQGPN